MTSWDRTRCPAYPCMFRLMENGKCPSAKCDSNNNQANASGPDDDATGVARRAKRERKSADEESREAEVSAPPLAASPRARSLTKKPRASAPAAPKPPPSPSRPSSRVAEVDERKESPPEPKQQLRKPMERSVASPLVAPRIPSSQPPIAAAAVAAAPFPSQLATLVVPPSSPPNPRWRSGASGSLDIEQKQSPSGVEHAALVAIALAVVSDAPVSAPPPAAPLFSPKSILKRMQSATAPASVGSARNSSMEDIDDERGSALQRPHLLSPPGSGRNPAASASGRAPNSGSSSLGGGGGSGGSKRLRFRIKQGSSGSPFPRSLRPSLTDSTETVPVASAAASSSVDNFDRDEGSDAGSLYDVVEPEAHDEQHLASLSYFSGEAPIVRPSRVPRRSSTASSFSAGYVVPAGQSLPPVVRGAQTQSLFGRQHHRMMARHPTQLPMPVASSGTAAASYSVAAASSSPGRLQDSSPQHSLAEQAAHFQSKQGGRMLQQARVQQAQQTQAHQAAAARARAQIDASPLRTTSTNLGSPEPRSGDGPLLTASASTTLLLSPRREETKETPALAVAASTTVAASPAVARQTMTPLVVPAVPVTPTPFSPPAADGAAASSAAAAAAFPVSAVPIASAAAPSVASDTHRRHREAAREFVAAAANYHRNQLQAAATGTVADVEMKQAEQAVRPAAVEGAMPTEVAMPGASHTPLRPAAAAATLAPTQTVAPVPAIAAVASSSASATASVPVMAAVAPASAPVPAAASALAPSAPALFVGSASPAVSASSVPAAPLSAVPAASSTPSVSAVHPARFIEFYLPDEWLESDSDCPSPASEKSGRSRAAVSPAATAFGPPRTPGPRNSRRSQAASASNLPVPKCLDMTPRADRLKQKRMEAAAAAAASATPAIKVEETRQAPTEAETARKKQRIKKEDEEEQQSDNKSAMESASLSPSLSVSSSSAAAASALAASPSSLKLVDIATVAAAVADATLPLLPDGSGGAKMTASQSAVLTSAHPGRLGQMFPEVSQSVLQSPGLAAAKEGTLVQQPQQPPQQLSIIPPPFEQPVLVRPAPPSLLRTLTPERRSEPSMSPVEPLSSRFPHLSPPRSNSNSHLYAQLLSSPPRSNTPAAAAAAAAATVVARSSPIPSLLSPSPARSPPRLALSPSLLSPPPSLPSTLLSPSPPAAAAAASPSPATLLSPSAPINALNLLQHFYNSINPYVGGDTMQRLTQSSTPPRSSEPPALGAAELQASQVLFSVAAEAADGDEAVPAAAAAAAPSRAAAGVRPALATIVPLPPKSAPKPEEIVVASIVDDEASAAASPDVAPNSASAAAALAGTKQRSSSFTGAAAAAAAPKKSVARTLVMPLSTAGQKRKAEPSESPKPKPTPQRKAKIDTDSEESSDEDAAAAAASKPSKKQKTAVAKTLSQSPLSDKAAAAPAAAPASKPKAIKKPAPSSAQSTESASASASTAADALASKKAKQQPTKRPSRGTENDGDEAMDDVSTSSSAAKDKPKDKTKKAAVVEKEGAASSAAAPALPLADTACKEQEPRMSAAQREEWLSKDFALRAVLGVRRNATSGDREWLLDWELWSPCWWSQWRLPQSSKELSAMLAQFMASRPDAAEYAREVGKKADEVAAAAALAVAPAAASAEEVEAAAPAPAKGATARSKR